MTYLLEITQSESEELDAVIERWGDPSNYTSTSERLMITTLSPLLLQLKSVCTVAPEVPVIDEKEKAFPFDELITESDQWRRGTTDPLLGEIPGSEGGYNNYGSEDTNYELSGPAPDTESFLGGEQEQATPENTNPPGSGTEEEDPFEIPVIP